MAVQVARAEVHPAINPSRIGLQYFFDGAYRLKDARPFKMGQHSETANQMGHHALVGGLMLLFAPNYFTQWRIQLAFQPFLSRNHGVGFILQITGQGNRIKTGWLRNFKSHLGQQEKQLISVAPRGIQQAIGPEFGLHILLMAQLDFQAKILELFNQRKTQQGWESPQFGACQRNLFLKRL